tara:strand:+ start:405 stop:581 length:177 start_codon:yes stop_codon:yes gene_type:complete
MAVHINVEDKLVSITTIKTLEFCEDCKGTGKREINFINPATNEIKKTVYLKCNCKEAA